jgi:ElaB/YqjD/DUF883 family membrane-anchored ribosome-binding protein
MNTASTVSQSMRETARDARDGAREVGKAASDASGDIQSDLQTLREDFSKLAEQVGSIVSDTGNAAWKHAKASVDGVVSDAGVKGREAVGAMREVSDNVVEAIDESLKTRPYTTLAVAAGLGFLIGAIVRR